MGLKKFRTNVKENPYVNLDVVESNLRQTVNKKDYSEILNRRIDIIMTVEDYNRYVDNK